MKRWFWMILLLSLSFSAHAMEGCGDEDTKCTDCHKFNLNQAAELLGKKVDRILAVSPAEVPGLWLVEVEKDKKKFPLYVDFSMSYIISGNIVRLDDGENITKKRMEDLNRVDFSAIPTDDALLLGKKGARTKVIVFTDPECPYCKKLHTELQQVVRRDPDIAFQIKLYPLKMHPNAYSISKSIVCRKSLALLEDSFAGKIVPPPLCETDQIDRNIELVSTLGIRSTPTLVLPDGRVMSGFKEADDILRLVGSKAVALVQKDSKK